MAPIIAAANASNVTAVAPRSFALPISGSRSSVILSANASTALFNASAAITSAMQSTIRHHSVGVIPNRNPAAIATTAATRCIRALCS